MASFTSFIGGLSPRALGQEADEKVKSIAAELAEYGYEIDIDALNVETASKRKTREDMEHQLGLLQAPEFFEMMCEFLHGIGNWEADTPDELKELGAKAVSAAVLAYYKPDRKALVVLEAPSSPVAKLTSNDFIIAHELIHAWRDQQSDLIKLMREGNPNAEELRIRLCLLEGEAQFAALMLTFGRQGIKVEDVEQDSLETPLDLALSGPLGIAYSKGASLALRYWQQGGWEAVHGMWDNPPTSTEQILHLDKLGVDLPGVISLPDWPLAYGESELLHDDCIGELGLYSLLLATGVEASEAKVAAAGWDADRFQVWSTSDNEVALIWRSVWDRDVDAAQYAAAAFKEGDALFRVRGRIIDWVRTVDGSLATKLLDELGQDGWMPAFVAGDAEGTEALETAWTLEVGDEPFLDQGHWVHPNLGFSFPAPDGWEQAEISGITMLVEELGKTPMPSMLAMKVPNPGGSELAALIELNGTQLDQMGFEIEELDIREIAGKDMLWARSQADMGFKFYSTTAIYLDGPDQVVITATIPLERWGDLESAVDEMFAGLNFDIEGYAPHEHTHEIDPVVPQVPSIETITLTMREAGRGTPMADLDVWIVERRAIRHRKEGRDQSKNMKLAERRGRRFRTDGEGHIDFPFQGDAEFWFCARQGELLGFGNVWTSHGDETLWLAPDKSIEVRVVDADGEPVANVPVGFRIHRGYGAVINGVVTSKRRTGKAVWNHALSVLDGLEESTTATLSFGFPTLNADSIGIWPEQAAGEPYTLEMPPTGSVLIRFESNDNSAEARFNGMMRDMMTSLKIAGVEPAIKYRLDWASKSQRTDEEAGGVLFPYVGLGLELQVGGNPFKEGKVFTGPRVAGERVEVVIKKDDESTDPDEY